jgi:hypothetical protein
MPPAPGPRLQRRGPDVFPGLVRAAGPERGPDTGLACPGVTFRLTYSFFE